MGALEIISGKFRSLRGWLFDQPDMPIVCEIAADYVAAIRQRRGQVEAWAVRPLPAGAVRPGPLTDNIADPAPVQAVLEEVVGAVDGVSRQCAVVIPDLAARVTLLEMEQLPSRPAEVEGLVRWRLSQDLSFDLDQARLSFQVQRNGGAKDEVVATVCLQKLLRQYEERLELLGLEPGVVTLSGLATLGWFPQEAAPRLLVKRTPFSLSVTVVQGGAVRLFRSVPLPPAVKDAPPGTALFNKIFPALVYFRDRSEEPVQNAFLCGLGEETEALKDRLEKEAGLDAEVLSWESVKLPPPALESETDPAWLLPSLGWVQAQGR